MANVNERPVWEDGVYQIEDSDVSSGGPDGLFNIQPKQLANRTAWLRQRLMAQTVIARLVDADGDIHSMVYVPRFTIPADAISAGRPSRDLHLGGFVVDQYHASLQDETKAVCYPLALPAVGLDVGEAGQAAIMRVINGVQARLMSLREWGHLAWLVEFLGHEIKGNLSHGRDPSDANNPSSYGLVVPGTNGMTLGGSGLASWSHNGLPTGIMDLVGNVEHMLSGPSWYGGCMEVRYAGKLVAPIDDDDADFVLEDDSNPLAGEFFAHWPETDGQLLLMTISGEPPVPQVERMTYQDLVAVDGYPARRTATNVVRGAFGTGSHAWAGDQRVYCVKYHCVIPGGYTALVSGNGLNNTTPGQATFNMSFGFLQTGTRDAAPAIGDVLMCGTELMLIDNIVGGAVTVTRGHNGTTIAAHAEDARISKVPASGVMYAIAGRLEGWATGFVRTHEDLEEYYIPSVSVWPPVSYDGPQRRFQLHLTDSDGVVVLRGGHYALEARQDMLRFTLAGPLMVAPTATGFRCAIDLT